MAWIPVTPKPARGEISKTDWNNVANNLDHLWEGSIEQNVVGNLQGGWGSAVPPQWAMTFTLEHKATIIYSLGVSATIYNGCQGSPKPEAVVGVMPRLNGVDVAPYYPLTARISNQSCTANNWLHVTGFLPDLDPGTYTLDFRFATLQTINFNVGGGADHSVSFSGTHKSLFEVLI